MHALSALLGDVVDAAAREPGDRRRHRRDPLHLRQHRAAQGRRAQPPQPDRRAPRASATYLGNTGDDVILAALPLSFDAGLSQLTTAFAVGAHVVLINYLLARDVVRLCARARVTGLTCVPPLWIQLADRRLAGRGDARRCATSPTPAAGCPRSTLDRLREIFPQAQPVPDVRPHRGVPLDLPRPGRGRPPPRLDRQGHPERRDPRRAARRHAVRARARRASWCTAARWSPWATGTTRSAPPSGSGPLPGGPDWRAPELAVWSGDTRRRRRGGLPLLRRPHRRHDQDLRLPGEPDRDRGGRLRHRPGPRRGRARRPGRPRSGSGSCSSSAPTAEGFDAGRAARRAAPAAAAATWCRREVVVRAELPRSPNGKFDRVLLREELTA